MYDSSTPLLTTYNVVNVIAYYTPSATVTIVEMIYVFKVC